MGMVNFSLHSPRTSWTRLDVYPFIILQGLNLIAIVVTCFSQSGSDVLEKDLPPWWLPCRPPLICSAAIPILLLLQALVHLGTYWSVEFKARVTMNRVSDISSAKYVKVQPRKVTEKPGICALETISLSDETGFASEVLILSTRLSIEPPFRGKTLVQRLSINFVRGQIPSFEFHKRRYLWDQSEKRFTKVSFPVDLTIDEYLRYTYLAHHDVTCA
jgi:hypothetical protein